MAEPVLDALERLFTAGDLDGLRGRLLHSTIWHQHQFTAFGEELISRCWLAWLGRCGLSRLEHSESVQAPGEALLLLTLRPERGRSAVRVGLWACHDGDRIKSVHCQFDTIAMARSLGLEPAELAARLPGPDPLVLGDYDPLPHPDLADVGPRDLLELPPGIREPLQDWWTIWQHAQLANVARCYAPAAQILLPGAGEAAARVALTGYCSGWFMRLDRRFCQPESVIVDESDPGAAAVLWRMEGDLHGPGRRQRVRVPVVSRLQFEDGAITGETMLVDEVALDRPPAD